MLLVTMIITAVKLGYIMTAIVFVLNSSNITFANSSINFYDHDCYFYSQCGQL